MDSHTLQPAPKPCTVVAPTLNPVKHPLYAWKSDALFEDNGTLFRGICYTRTPDDVPGWTKVGPVGCLFAAGTTFPAPAPTAEDPNPGPVLARPLVQFARRVTEGVAYTLELAPSVEGTSEYKQWRERRETKFSDSGTVLGYVLPPTTSQPGQLTRPLYSAQVRGDDGLPLNQVVTTDLSTWQSFMDGGATSFSLENPALDDVQPLAQIVPVFEVEIDVVAGSIVPTVLVGTVGAAMGDIEIPPGPGSMIRFFRRFDATFSLDDITVYDSTGSVATGFVSAVNTDATVLIANTAPAGLYDYTIFITQQATGDTIQLDPKLRNRSDGGG